MSGGSSDEKFVETVGNTSFVSDQDHEVDGRVPVSGASGQAEPGQDTASSGSPNKRLYGVRSPLCICKLDVPRYTEYTLYTELQYRSAEEKAEYRP